MNRRKTNKVGVGMKEKKIRKWEEYRRTRRRTEWLQEKRKRMKKGVKEGSPLFG